MTKKPNAGKKCCSKEHGRKGERETYAVIRGMEQVVPFNLYSNVYLRKDRRGLTEIDLFLVSENGLIAIENKEYSGIITGSPADDTWVCTYRRKNENGKRVQRMFCNPVRQNRMHIRLMAAKMGIDADEFLSVIVFPDEATISIHEDRLPKTLVIHRSSLPEAINTYLSENKPKFNPNLLDGWNSWLLRRLV